VKDRKELLSSFSLIEQLPYLSPPKQQKDATIFKHYCSLIYMMQTIFCRIQRVFFRFKGGIDKQRHKPSHEQRKLNRGQNFRFKGYCRKQLGAEKYREFIAQKGVVLM